MLARGLRRLRRQQASQEGDEPWESVHAALAPLRGEEGVERRRAAYRPYFLQFGEGVRIEHDCLFVHPDRIALDDGVRINTGVRIYGSGGVRFGRHTRLGPGLFVHSADHDVSIDDPRALWERGYRYASVEVGDNCVLAGNVSVMPGARIGDGTFVAAGAVVTRHDFPPGSRLFGIPARHRGSSPSPVVESPQLAVRADGDVADSARALIGALGLVQARVFGSRDELPVSVKVELALSGTPRADAWTLGRLTDLQSTGIELRMLPIRSSARSLVGNAVDLTLWGALRRREVGRRTSGEAGRWRLLLAVIERLEPAGSRLASIARDATANAAEGEFVPTGPSPLAEQACLSVLAGDDARARAAAESIVAEFVDESTAGVRSARGSNAYTYDPAVIGALLWHSRTLGDGEPRLGEAATLELSHDWREGVGAIVDDSRRLVGEHLWHDWLLLATPPAIPDGSRLAEAEDAYPDVLALVEGAWLEAFRRILGDAGLPLVRVRPWPYPYHAALSVRYDVDRPVALSRIVALAREQAAVAGRPCGSWFLFPEVFGDSSRETKTWLRAFGQSVGVHIRRPADAVPGVGVTCHSGIGAEYWAGRRTLAGLDARGAAYGELLCVQGRVPRRVPACETWVGAAPYPLEGSPDNRGLDFFDQRRESANRLLADGGHLVLGTHPDVAQDHVVALLRRIREDGGVWFASIDEAVTRCRRTIGYGAVGMSESGTALVSESGISDLSIEIVLPDGTRSERVLQLMPGCPRPLEPE